MFLRVAMTLQQAESPVIHVRGKNTLYSCYDLDKYVSHVIPMLHALYACIYMPSPLTVARRA
jgi:hypothetical protein